MRRKLLAFLVVLGALLVMAAQCPFDPDLPDPGPGPEPDPTPTPGEIMFFDDFNNGVSSSFGLSSGTWEEVGGEIHPLTDDASAFVTVGDSWTDYEASADFRYDDLEDLGHSSRRGLAVRVNGQRKVVFWGTSGKMWFDEYQPDEAPYRKRMGNSVNEPMPLVCSVRVRVSGNRFQAFVNDVLILEAEDANNRYPSGTTGIEVHDDHSWEDAAEKSFFDNFLVRELE